MTRDGEWIVYSSGNSEHPGIFKIRPDGSDAEALVAGNYVQPDVSPDGRHFAYVATDNARLANTVFVSNVETGERTPFEVEITHDLLSPNVTYGRARWMPDGSAVVFVGLDEQGRTGLWRQDFHVDRNAPETRRRVTGFDSDVVHESFGIAPDGVTLTLSSNEQVRTINLADGLPRMR
jgi:Tol biopolymer transport system component